MCASDIFLALIAILFPPIAVWIKCGLCSADSLINIALCMLGYVPGLLHAWYIIAKYPDEAAGYETIPSHRDEEHGGTVTYYYVHQGGPRAESGSGNPAQPPLPSQAAHTMNAGAPSAQGRTPPVGPSEGAEQGGSAAEGVPPTYAEAVKGDHKVQK